MELKNLLENRNTTFVRISEAADYLGTCLRENVVVFDVVANKQKTTFLSESGYLIGATYKIEEDVISLSNFEVESSEDILSDEKVDTFVNENVGSLVTALNSNHYDTAENSFSQIIEAFSYRNQINEVRGELYKKMSRFDHKTVVRDTVEYCKLQEMQGNVKAFIKDNINEVLGCTDVSNALKLSKALSTAFNKAPRIELAELAMVRDMVVTKETKNTLYETICKQELIHKELLESKRNFSSLWADNETISRLASCIYSDEESIEAAIVETIRDVPYFALASKSDINEVVTAVYEVTNPGTVSKKDIRAFVAQIFEVKKPAKDILISTLNENYGINVNNLKFIPSFSNLAKTQSVMFEALSKMTEDSKVLSEFLHEFSSFIKNKGGVEVLDINDFIAESFAEAGEEYDAWFNEKLDLEQLGEAVANEYSLSEANKKKEKPSDVGGDQYRGDDEQYIDAEDEEEGSPNKEYSKKDDGESKGDKGKDKDDPDAKDYERGGDRKGDEGAGDKKDDKGDYTTDARKGDKGKGKDKDDKPDYTTDARKGDKGKGKDKDDKPDYTTDQRKGDKSKTHAGKDFEKTKGDLDGDGDVDDVDKKVSSERKAILKSRKKSKLKEAVEAPEYPEQEVPEGEQEEAVAEPGALSDNEIKDLVTDVKDMMKDLDFKSLTDEEDEQEDTNV